MAVAGVGLWFLGCGEGGWWASSGVAVSDVPESEGGAGFGAGEEEMGSAGSIEEG